MQELRALIRLFTLKAIKIYQASFSRDHGRLSFLYPTGYCRFKPTCSEYAYEAIEKYGLIKGGFMAFGRVCRCHPFSKGGWDPVDKENK